MECKDDLFLLQEIKLGNEKAFKILFTKYRPRLTNYAYRFVNNQTVVEDLVQETFEKIWEKRHTLSLVSVSSLLFTIIRNKCINYLKRQSILEISSIEYLENLEGEERLYNLDLSSGAEMPLMVEEMKEQIEMVLRQLPERTKEIFLLRRDEGLKNREISERLGISTTAVEKHMSRALMVFKIHFREKYPTEIYELAIALLLTMYFVQ
ncbi:RNA polymerase sigma-70 factor [Ornithobacterium rhinotracheale]|uniref:RNA polymerase sigma-70 factor n=1 Tax=Ornithobacterium rhinotracheale TaxID=28251 RepID=UPI00129CA192|nr:RNA polymerase sigma-70 factor [Ornithobacterium rhinotracheale]MRI63762.1 RNA polymerase sigma-70 factor [Ornithobacterium rhinotracheale]